MVFIVCISVIAYIYSAVVVGKMIFNYYIEPVYGRELKKETIRRENSHGYSRSLYEREGTVEQVAYKKARLMCDAEAGAAVLGFLLPLGILWLICLKYNRAGKLFPKNVMQKDLDNKAKIAQEKSARIAKEQEWYKVLKEMENMGIDTQKLRELGNISTATSSTSKSRKKN